MSILQEYIQKLLDEKRRTDKEGISTPRGLEVLEQYRDDVFTQIHFSSIHKVGINPQNKFRTPLGIFGYPMTERTWKKLETDQIEFRGEMKYLHVYRPRSEAKTIITTQFTKDDLKECIGALKEMFPDTASMDFDDWAYDARVSTPMGQLWNITRMLANRDPNKWASIFVDLGIEGVIDLNQSIIHPSEPEQSDFFRTQFVEHIDTIENPLRQFDKKLTARDVPNSIMQSLTDEDFVKHLISSKPELSPKILEKIFELHPKLVLANYGKITNIASMTPKLFVKMIEMMLASGRKSYLVDSDIAGVLCKVKDFSNREIENILSKIDFTKYMLMTICDHGYAQQSFLETMEKHANEHSQIEIFNFFSSYNMSSAFTLSNEFLIKLSALVGHGEVQDAATLARNIITYMQERTPNAIPEVLENLKNINNPALRRMITRIENGT